jgi:CPA1 family monovalent cation:H+ antiporter
MQGLTVLLVLLATAAALAPVARWLNVPLAIVHVAGGMALALTPSLRSFQLEPKVAFTIFVPPLLYWAAISTSLREFRRAALPIGFLATTLVAFTVLAVAVAAHATVGGLAWAPAFVPGAIVAPPDASVVTAIAPGLGIPRRLITLLEGETLMNDAVAFLAYNMAIAAALTGTFRPAIAVTSFFWSIAAGVGLGLLAARLVGWLRVRANYSEVENTISILTPFAAYMGHFDHELRVVVAHVADALAHGNIVSPSALAAAAIGRTSFAGSSHAENPSRSSTTGMRSWSLQRGHNFVPSR